MGLLTNINWQSFLQQFGADVAIVVVSGVLAVYSHQLAALGLVPVLSSILDILQGKHSQP